MDVNKIVLKYCLIHDKEVFVSPGIGSVGEYHLYANGNRVCYGKFAECPPPPPLTEPEWQQLLSEGDNYATETI